LVDCNAHIPYAGFLTTFDLTTSAIHCFHRSCRFEYGVGKGVHMQDQEKRGKKDQEKRHTTSRAPHVKLKRKKRGPTKRPFNLTAALSALQQETANLQTRRPQPQQQSHGDFHYDFHGELPMAKLPTPPRTLPMLHCLYF
jgi:hypothetical protein